MAQRASGLARKTAAARPAAELESAKRADSRAIPIDIAPLIAPFKGSGRLTLRVERLPPLARLSAGRNNGDNSWSLRLDELEDLSYVPPETGTGPDSLALRVMTCESEGATTLAVLDLPLSRDGSSRSINGRDAMPAAELARLRQQLRSQEIALDRHAQRVRELQESLSDRDAEVEKLRTARVGRQPEIEAALAIALADWKVGEAGRLAAAEARWRAEAARHTGEGDKKHQDKLAELSASLAAARKALAESEAEAARVKAARTGRQPEIEAALAAAHADWKSGEAARLAAADARWREQSESEVQKWRQKCERAESECATREQAFSQAQEENRTRLEELKRLREVLAARETELARAGESLAELKRTSARELEAAASSARRDWDERLAAAEQNWQNRIAATIAELRARCEKSEAELRARAQDEAQEKTELATRDELLAGLRTVLAERELAIADLSRKHQEQEAHWSAVLKAARDAEADARRELALANTTEEAEWRRRYEQPLSEARGRYEAAELALADMRKRTGGVERELDGLHEEHGRLKAIVAEREEELAKLRALVAGTPEPPADDRVRPERLKSLGPALFPDAASQKVEPATPRRSLVRDGLLAFALVFAPILLYTLVSQGLPEGWKDNLVWMTGGIPNSKPVILPAKSSAGASGSFGSEAAQATATLLRRSNLRAEPDASAHIDRILTAGTQLQVVERKSDWVHVRVRELGSVNGALGWVLGTNLQITAPGPRPASSE